MTESTHARGILQVALLNSMYGNGGPGFGDRHIRGGAGKGAALLSKGGGAAIAAKLGRKQGTRKAGVTCKACGQVPCPVLPHPAA